MTTSRHKNSKRILFICPYPINQAPSQRFRFEQYLTFLKENNFQIQLEPFLPISVWQSLYTQKKKFHKVWWVILGYLKRIWLLFSVNKYQFIFIHREATPLGPPIIEWFIAKLSRAKIIYDFDDAIWLTDKEGESKFEKMFRWRSKVSSICKWSFRISCGNKYLADYARNFNSNVIVNPTTIDLKSVDNFHKDLKSDLKINDITIGWTGSHSTLKYLTEITKTIQQLEKVYPQIVILVIADKKPFLDVNKLKFVKWNNQTEIKDLINISIGIMPLPDNDWTLGKCGFKILQYMALGIPSIASNVGTNKEIIQHGINGYLCSTPEEWLACFEQLITNPSLRFQIGKNGRKTVEKAYSVDSNKNNFLSLFELE